MRTHALFVAFILTLVLAGCAGPENRVMARDQAVRDTRPMQLKVLGVYANDRLDYTTEFHVSHVIEVEVVEGPAELKGTKLTLPYDEFNVGEPPPGPDEEVTIAPADWVKPNPGAKYKPRK